MRKSLQIALVLVMLCALKGFAQEETGGGWNVFGSMQTGINIQFTDMLDDGPFIYAGGQEKSEAAYMLLKINWANPTEVFGFETGAIFKGTGISANIDGSYGINWNIKVDNTFGWIKFLDKRITLYGGGGEFEFGEHFKTPGPVDSNLDMAGFGAVLICQPLLGLFNDMHNLRIGASAWVKEGHQTLINEAKYIGHIAYLFEDLFTVNFNFAYRQYGPKFYADEESGDTTYNDQLAKDHRLNFGVNFIGLEEFGFRKIAVDAEFRDLGGGRTTIFDKIAQFNQNRAGDYMVIKPFHFGQTIQWIGINDKLSVTASFKQVLYLGDDEVKIYRNANDYTNKVNTYAPSLSYMVDVSFKVLDYLIPKLGLVYIQNSNPFDTIASDLRFNEGLISDSCEKDTGGIQIRAAVELVVMSKGFLELGYSINKNLTKDIVATNRQSTMDHGPYLSLKVNF